MSDEGVPFTEVQPRLATRAELERVHAPHYIDEVLNHHLSGEWSGQRPDLANLASLFAGGTLVALEALLSGKTLTAINFPGSKHHAQFDHSSGFCVFADFALAADVVTKDFGKKVAILDIDAHHGDGTENLTAENPEVLTFSIHEKGIFPGTGNQSDPEKNIYNYPLVSNEEGHNSGKDNQALHSGVEEFCRLADRFKPNLIFIACGADGLHDDPLTGLVYTVEGYAKAMKRIREAYPVTPILFGGAGGYLPDDGTPTVWAESALALISSSAMSSMPS